MIKVALKASFVFLYFSSGHHFGVNYHAFRSFSEVI